MTTNPNSIPVPSRAEQELFGLRLYFGWREPLVACVRRAYRDLSRTLHGVAGADPQSEVRAAAAGVVEAWLRECAGQSMDQGDFDQAHRATCDALCAVYGRGGFGEFRVGQAQKWLNMALKYVYVFGEQHVPGFEGLYGLAHIPLDGVILPRLGKHGAPQLGARWSRLASYEEYFDYQLWVRRAFPGSAPLAVEFYLWQGEAPTG